MAKIGVRYPRYCPYTIVQNPDGTETEVLGTGKVMGKATSVNVTVNAEIQRQAADDGDAEVVAEFTGGTIANGLNDLVAGVESELLGHELAEDGELIARSDDNAPYARVGFIGSHLLNNQRLYKATVYMRAKYSPPGAEYTTKGQTVTFGDVTLNGALMRNADGVWKKEKTFTTQSEAVAYLNNLLNMGGEPPELTYTSVPAAGATGASKADPIVITFANVIDHGNATLVNAATNAVVPAAKSFDGTKKVLTITPNAALSAETEYLVVLDITDAYAQNLSAVINFTTEA